MRQLLAAGALILAVSANAAVPSSERDALVALYQSTGGTSWANATNWLGAAGTECTWFGVRCDENEQHVIDLELYQNNLSGALPRELGQLAELRSLYAQNNHLTGPVPPEWGALKKLVYLGLDGNQLRGPLPRELGAMTSLQELGLSYNEIDGAIPKELGNLTNLTSLQLSANRLTGKIPSELGSLAKLEYLGLADNKLSGAIPPELGNATTLVDLRLSYNDFEGTIPSSFGALDKLEVLDVTNNHLSGAIPAALGGLASIKQLVLTTNDFSDAIPDALYDLTTLEELALGDNELRGAISPRLANLRNLQVLGLYANHFEGTIPLELTTIAPLRSLELQGNDLTGTIPPELAHLTNLTWIDLAQNELEGEIPPQLGTLAKLEVLSLYENAFTGTIPVEVGQLTNLHILYLAGNQLTGTIPDTLRNLTKLEQLTLGGNALTGSIPSWIGELRELRDLLVDANKLTGTLPESLATLDNLEYLGASENQLTGHLPDFTRLTKLRYITLTYNQLSGAIPPSIGGLTQLTDLRLDFNALTGPIPPEFGNLTSAEYVNLSNNALTGTLPPELGNLQNVYALALWGNRFEGTIPPQLGDLSKLQYLDLSFNALRGPIPKAITKLTALQDEGSDFNFNALFATDASVRDFVNRKQYAHDFEATQTLTPANVRVTQTTDRSVTIAWAPIRYDYDHGGYQVVASASRGGAPASVATTSSKEFESATVRNLDPSTRYFFTVSTVTHPHSQQPNLIVSDPSDAINATTGPRVLAPAEVVVTEAPKGMVQIDGVPTVEDEFTVTNFGDVETTITLERGGDFFTLDPPAFTLAGGASRTVALHSIAQQPGTYWGNVVINGQGADGLYVDVVLLATARPSGVVIAEPLATTIELAGAAGSDEVGTAQFRNSGSARLSGIVVSDQPWVVPDTEPITIEPGSIGSVNFRVVRSKKPANAFAANLTLIYVSGGESAASLRALDTSSSVSVSKVTIVDVTQPPVTTGTLPPLRPGEIPLFIPGIVRRGATRSDVSIVNAAGLRAIDDLKLYFTSGSATNIASFPSLGSSQSLQLANVLTSVYGASSDAVGTLQVRSGDWNSIATEAKATPVTPAGTFSGAIPVFRGDRSTAQSEILYLTGLTSPGDLVLQETTGAPANVRIDFLDASGAAVGVARGEVLAAGALAELRDAIPATAVTAIVTNVSGSAGAIHAYARLRDASGDTWSIVDWSRFHRYARSEAVRIPFADGRGSGGGRRRAVRNATGTTARGATDVTIFNPAAAEVRVKLQVIETSGRTAEREVVIPARTTTTLRDVGGTAGTTVAHVVVQPIVTTSAGDIVVTARSRGANGGSAIPVLAATAGLRLGQSVVFSGLEDSTAFRTSYGLVETGGATAKVRARIVIDETNALVAASTSRTFTLAPREQLFLPELVRSFAGDARDTAFGDLHNLTLELEVIEGPGAVVPFIIETDTGTGDSNVRTP